LLNQRVSALWGGEILILAKEASVREAISEFLSGSKGKEEFKQGELSSLKTTEEERDHYLSLP